MKFTLKSISCFDNMMLSPEKSKLDGIGYMENYTHLGSAYFIHPDVNQSFIDDIYTRLLIFKNNTTVE